MDATDTIMDNGLMFGIYATGPWLGLKFSNNPNVGWIGAGKTQHDFMVIFSKKKITKEIQKNPGLEALMHIYKQNNWKIQTYRKW